MFNLSDMIEAAYMAASLVTDEYDSEESEDLWNCTATTSDWSEVEF